jgi:hypothetical protein
MLFAVLFAMSINDVKLQQWKMFKLSMVFPQKKVSIGAWRTDL